MTWIIGHDEPFDERECDECEDECTCEEYEDDRDKDDDDSATRWHESFGSTGGSW